MFQYLAASCERKLARRFTRRYAVHVASLDLPAYGRVQFALWKNPLAPRKAFSQDAVAFFGTYLKAGDLAIDIGANIGMMTVPMGLAAGKRGLTIGFDPNPFVFEVLCANARLNRDKTNIAVHNLAITDTEGEFFYHSSEASFSNGGISAEDSTRHGRYALPAKIKGVQLESFLDEHYPAELKKLKLVKVDAEGYDKRIIKSISGLLTKYKPVVITECWGGSQPAERFEQFDLLKGAGYAIKFLGGFDAHAQMLPLTRREDMLKWKDFDLLAIPEG